KGNECGTDGPGCLRARDGGDAAEIGVEGRGIGAGDGGPGAAAHSHAAQQLRAGRARGRGGWAVATRGGDRGADGDGCSYHERCRNTEQDGASVLSKSSLHALPTLLQV